MEDGDDGRIGGIIRRRSYLDDESHASSQQLLEKQVEFLQKSLRNLEQRIKSQETASFTEESHRHDDDDDDDHDNDDDDDDDLEKSSEEDLDKSILQIPHTSFREGTNKASLSQDTFSFIISAHPWSLPFSCGVFVFFLKNVIFVLVLTNMINYDVRFNKLGVPVSVSTTVVISQFIAFAISVFTQNDLITAFIHLFQGHTPNMVKAFSRNGNGGGYRYQWLLAVTFLACDGVFGLVVTFLLVVTSNTVLNVLLNFAAVEFVAGLDESVFYLASTGFLGRKLMHESVVVAESSYIIRRSATRKRMHRIQTAGLTTVLFVVMVLWAYLFWLQRSGVYNPKHMIIQFDDLIQRDLGAYSGYYTLKTDFSKPPPRRFRYVELRNGNGQFAYCQKNREWAFFTDGNDPCDYSKIHVKSTITHELDMSNLAGSAWLVKRPGTQHFIPMQNFFMDIGCTVDRHCGNVGKCVDNKCKCNQGHYGWRCDFSQDKACASLTLDERFDVVFPSTRLLATSFQQLLPVNESDPNVPTLYQHPIYHAPNPISNATDILMYMGLRWGITQIRWMKNVSSLEDLRDRALNARFSAIEISRVFTLTDPVAYFTPDDKRSNPIKVNWNLVELNGPLSQASVVASANPVSLICSKCNNSTNKCTYNNVCGADGKCQCLNGASGSLCQIDPTNDGICNPHFNRRHFQYDGGDCCRRNCDGSNAGNQCGIIEVGTNMLIDYGFPECVDPGVVGTCANTTDPCYIQNSNPIDGRSPGRGVYPVLTANGRILVAGELSIGLVRVFDLEDSTWTQRGFDLRGRRSDGFGRVIAASSPPREINNGALGKVPVIVAVGEDFNNGVRVFEWARGGNSWVETPRVDIPLTTSTANGVIDGYNLRIGADFLNGNANATARLLIQTTSTNGGSNQVYVYRRPLWHTSSNWTLQDHFDGIQYSAVSSDGGIVARISGDFRSVSIQDFQPRQGQPPLDPSYALVSKPGSTEEVLAMSVTDVRGNLNQHQIGVAVITRRSSSTGAFVDLDYYILDIHANTTVWSQRTSETVNVTDSALVDAVFSNEGRAVALTNQLISGELTHTTYRFDGIRGWQRFAPLKSSFSQKRLGVIGISDDGTYLVDGATGTLQVHETGYPSCGVGEVTYRLSINMNEKPESVVWSLNAYRWVDNAVEFAHSFFWCDRCHSGALYGWSVTAQEICVPREALPCLGLEFQANFSLPTNGFASYIIEGRNALSLFAADSGALPLRTSLPYHLNTTLMQTSACNSMQYGL